MRHARHMLHRQQNININFFITDILFIRLSDALLAVELIRDSVVLGQKASHMIFCIVNNLCVLYNILAIFLRDPVNMHCSQFIPRCLSQTVLNRDRDSKRISDLKRSCQEMNIC